MSVSNFSNFLHASRLTQKLQSICALKGSLRVETCSLKRIAKVPQCSEGFYMINTRVED